MPLKIDTEMYPAAVGKEDQILAAFRELYQQPSLRNREQIRQELDALTGIWHATRPIVPAPETRHEIRIIPVETGVQVAYGPHVSRAFPSIRDLCIENGRPLYVAMLPNGEQNYYSRELVVYGTEEFRDPENVDHIYGIIGDQPIFSGYTYEDGVRSDTMIDGTGAGTEHDEIDPDSVELVCDKTVYVARKGDFWLVFVDGQPRGGRFDQKPTVDLLEGAHPLVSSLFHTAAVNRLSVTGEREGLSQQEVIDFCPDIAKHLADVA